MKGQKQKLIKVSEAEGRQNLSKPKLSTPEPVRKCFSAVPLIPAIVINLLNAPCKMFILFFEYCLRSEASCLAGRTSCFLHRGFLRLRHMTVLKRQYHVGPQPPWETQYDTMSVCLDLQLSQTVQMSSFKIILHYFFFFFEIMFF